MSGPEGGGLAVDLALLIVAVACLVAVTWVCRRIVPSAARWLVRVARPLPPGWRADARTVRTMQGGRR